MRSCWHWTWKESAVQDWSPPHRVYECTSCGYHVVDQHNPTWKLRRERLKQLSVDTAVCLVGFATIAFLIAVGCSIIALAIRGAAQ